MYAVIKAGGKQHRVKPGDVIEVELMHGQQGTSISFTPLLVVDDDGKTHIGKDLGKAQVKAKLLGEQKGDKVKVFKYRPKTGYARHQGHRQMHTLVEIEDVVLGGRRAASKKSEEESAEEAPAVEAAAEAPKPKPRSRAKRETEVEGATEIEGATKDSPEDAEAPA
jgi:large subunit ribosomal protein L21